MASKASSLAEGREVAYERDDDGSDQTARLVKSRATQSDPSVPKGEELVD